jgi:hypothetical protein
MGICICYHHLHLSHFCSVLNPTCDWTLQHSHAVIKCWSFDSCLVSWYGSPCDKFLTHLWLHNRTRHAKVLPPFYDMLLWILHLLWQSLPLICSNHRIHWHRYQLKKRTFYAHHSVHRESIPKKFQQDDTLVQYFIISCKSLYMFHLSSCWNFFGKEYSYISCWFWVLMNQFWNIMSMAYYIWHYHVYGVCTLCSNIFSTFSPFS